MTTQHLHQVLLSHVSAPDRAGSEEEDSNYQVTSWPVLWMSASLLPQAAAPSLAQGPLKLHSDNMSARVRGVTSSHKAELLTAAASAQPPNSGDQQ